MITIGSLTTKELKAIVRDFPELKQEFEAELARREEDKKQRREVAEIMDRVRVEVMRRVHEGDRQGQWEQEFRKQLQAQLRSSSKGKVKRGKTKHKRAA
jgi:hypothetical protein